MSKFGEKFVSYKFIDSEGNLRDKIVKTDSELKSTCFDGSSFGFRPTNNSDLILYPDENAIYYDPIRGMKTVFCFLKTPNGEYLEDDFRYKAFSAMKKDPQCHNSMWGVEPEFFILSDEDRVDLHLAKDQYKWYGCLPPTDTLNDVKVEIVRNLEDAGIDVISIHSEVAPKQNEISWRKNKLLKVCDQMLLFKYIVSVVCEKSDLYVDFRAKPFENLNGNGCHVHCSLPCFATHPQAIEIFGQGLVEHYDELFKVCCVGNTSKDRLVEGYEAPTNNGIGFSDRTKSVRIPSLGGRLEYRLPDPEMNPYIVLPTILNYGRERVKRECG